MWLLLLLATDALSAPCDNDDVRKVAQAVAGADPTVQAVLAVQGISEACKKAPPYFPAFARTVPSMYSQISAAGVSEQPGAWAKACPAKDPHGLLEHAFQLNPADRGRTLGKGCAVLFATDEELAAAEGDIVTAIFAAHVLRHTPLEARALARAIAGVPPR